MDPDKRIVPEKRLSYLLEEEHTAERSKAVKHTLIRSPKKIDKVADYWVDSTGINSLARIMLKNVEKVPHKITSKDKHHTVQLSDHSHEPKNTTEHVAHETHGGVKHEPHGAHHDIHDQHHGDHAPTHGHHTESHGQHNHGGHGEHHENIHGHDHETHGNGHHDDHSHHSHGHKHHGGHFSSYISSGHWCGQQGARIFAMVGRIFGEIVGYIIKTFIVAILFGPTRTALLVLFISIFLNNTMSTSLPIGIAASIAGIIHLIFTGIEMMSAGGGHGGSEHGGGHGHH